MEQKNRLIIVVTVTVLIVIAMFASFGRNLFAKNPPEIVLPAADSSQGSSGSLGGSDSFSNQFQQVSVTPETVQSIIASLSRSSSYYRELTVETFWSDSSSSTTTVQTWVDGGWTHTAQTLPSGLIRHDIVGDGQVYYWYEGDQTWRTAPSDQLSADLAQHIPTYETVLELDPAAILDTSYELRGDLSCIYVQVQGAVEGYEERYWISVDSGLLVSAESLENGQLVYSMTALSPVQSIPSDSNIFSLPDGTVLHQ